MNTSSIRIRLVLLAAGVAAAAQLTLGGLLALWSARRAESEARVQLDTAERIVTSALGQRREQAMLAAVVASRDPQVVKSLTDGPVESLADVLLPHAKRIGASRVMFLRQDGTVVADAGVAQATRLVLKQDAALRTAIVFGRGAGIVARGEDVLMWAVGTVSPEQGGVVMVESIRRRLAEELAVMPGVAFSVGRATPVAADPNGLEASAWRRRLLLTEAGPDAVALDLSMPPVTAGGIIGESAPTWLIALLVALVAAGAGTYAAGAGWLAPLGRMQASLRRIGTGDYQPIRDCPPGGEIGDLAQAFNSMLEGLQQRERRILQTAYRDPLTSLPNRTLFQDRIAEAVQVARKANRSVAVLLLDINQFKSVNESLGHAAGDMLLIEVSERVRKVLRGADNMMRVDNERRRRDPREDKNTSPTVARLAGDDFAVLLPGCSGEQAERIAARVLDVLRRPFVHDGQTVVLASTIGVAAFPEHALDADALVQAADNALYEAKANHRSLVSFDVEHERNREQHMSLLGDLRRALDHDELSLVFQPKVSLNGSPRLMVEALLRWVHPERGPQSPADFVPFAEKTGFITSLTRWVLDQSLQQAARWLKSGLAVQVGVNVSARDLASEDFTTYVIERLRHHGMRAEMLTIEINEAALIKEPHAARQCLEVLDRLGVKLSIDDFGTGFSSLRYLRELPVDAVKIDRTFVSELLTDAGSRVVVKSTIDLAHSLSLRAVAEGVESPEILQVLRELGCDYAQGYYFGRPLSAEDYASWVEHQARRFDAASPEAAASVEDEPTPSGSVLENAPHDEAVEMDPSALNPSPDALAVAEEIRLDAWPLEEAPKSDAGSDDTAEGLLDRSANDGNAPIEAFMPNAAADDPPPVFDLEIDIQAPELTSDETACALTPDTEAPAPESRTAMPTLSFELALEPEGELAPRRPSEPVVAAEGARGPKPTPGLALEPLLPTS